MAEKNKLSPGMKQYRAIKEKYNDCILFFRMGDFYEMFDDDAILASRELGITLTGKNCGLEERIPMCGVPFHSYETYCARLIANGHKVAICEQLTPPGKNIVQRDVVRVITPGTLIDSTMLDETTNTYIMCVYKKKDKLGYAYADISTGEFCTGFYEGDKALNSINDQIVRVRPAEIICNADFYKASSELYVFKSGQMRNLQEYYEWSFNLAGCEKTILDAYNLKSIKGYDFENSSCLIAIGALWQYVNETQKRELHHMSMPRLINDNQYMYIDTNTRRNLELELTMRDGNKHGSLNWVLDKSQTGGGSRMLKRFIREPLQDIDLINKRLDAIEAIIKNPMIKASLIAEFKGIRDIERLVGKISYGTITPKDCLAIKETLNHTPNIHDILVASDNITLKTLAKDIIDLSCVRDTIHNLLKSDLDKQGEEGIIRDGYSTELDYLRDLYLNTKDKISRLEIREREQTGIKNLKIGYNRVFGFYIEINKQFSNQVPYNYVRKQTVSNNERYITEELKEFEDEVLSSKDRAEKLEADIFNKFKKDLFVYFAELQGLARAISTVDALLSLAIVAEENNYVRPTLTDNSVINIKNGRHPVIEKIQKDDSFIANDCLLDDKDNRTMVLTGPNMAGKSTYMRQIALITFMAHIGSFVPADSAEICLVDRIFTRIGASDDLAVGQSTFMVEMVEVSNILRFATNKSLIILDEVGRGTSTHDGLSIAWSVVEYLCKHLNAKTLFATHYHELLYLEKRLDGVKNYTISIKEIAGQLVFLRKIMRGGTNKSYGVEVASLAGLPDEIIKRSKQILNDLKDGNFDEIKADSPKSFVETCETPLKNQKEVYDIISAIDINNITPMVAFDTLSRLVDIVKK